MDPLSVLASTAALSHVVHNLYQICDSLRNETEQRKALSGKLDLIQCIITALDRRRQSFKPGQVWYQGLEALEAPEGPLEQLKKTLQDLEVELTSSKQGGRRLAQKLRWHWDKDEYQGALADVDALCQRINTILSQDQWSLTVAHYDLSSHQEERRQRDEGEALKREIVTWLSPLHFLARQKEIFEKSFPTGDVLLKSHEFRYAVMLSITAKWSTLKRDFLSEIRVRCLASGAHCYSDTGRLGVHGN